MLISCLHSSFITLWPLALPAPRWARWGMGVTYTPVLWYTAGAYSIPMTFISSHPELPLRTLPLNRIRVRLGDSEVHWSSVLGREPWPQPTTGWRSYQHPQGRAPSIANLHAHLPRPPASPTTRKDANCMCWAESGEQATSHEVTPGESQMDRDGPTNGG